MRTRQSYKDINQKFVINASLIAGKGAVFEDFSQEDFSDFCSKESLQFPNSYINFLKKANGGGTSLFQDLYIKNGMRKVKIFGFRSFVKGGGIVAHPETWQTCNEVRPSFFYEICSCSLNNEILLGVKEPYLGMVFIFNDRRTQVYDPDFKGDVLKDKGLIKCYPTFLDFVHDFRCEPKSYDRYRGEKREINVHDL